MGVQVDQPRREEPSGDVDDVSRVSGQIRTDGDDDTVADGQVTLGGAGQQQVICHRSAPPVAVRAEVIASR